MASVRRLGVDAVELAHPLGKVGVGRLDDEVIMVRHLAVCVATPGETGASRAEHAKHAKHAKPIRAVAIIAIDRLAPIAARRHVIEPAGELDA